MLNRLFGSVHKHDIEDDQRTRHLLHGGISDLGGICSNGTDDIRLIVAQDLGDKAKVTLYDSAQPADRQKPVGLHELPTKRSSTSSELLCELMFGSVPLSYKGTSVRLHPLSIQNAGELDERRSFLFTKVFNVNVAGFDSYSPSAGSGNTSLSSSWQSHSGKEYPFPAMTPIQDSRVLGSAELTLPDHGASRTSVRALSSSAKTTASTPRHHQRLPSASYNARERNPPSSNRSDTEAAPYVPFSKLENHAPEDYFSGWLPSPGPTLTRRRRSIETNSSLSPGAHCASRFQSAVCAIGIVFSVPGDGQQHTECLLLTRYWQVITRAMYSLQRVLYCELESALSVVASHGAVQIPRNRTRPASGEARVYLRGKKYHVALGRHSLRGNVPTELAIERFCARMACGISLPNVLSRSLEQEVDSLVQELSFIILVLDKKECRFLFSTLASQLYEQTRQVKSQKRRHLNALFSRFLVLSADTLITRRLIYCIARLFFRVQSAGPHSDIDYSLVWPSAGLLGTRKKELMQRRRCSMAKAVRVHRALDIPGLKLNAEPASISQMSPSAYYRPPSTSSNQSSKNSSWKPGWSWFANSSRARLTDESSNRSDQRTMQTSWDSTDFNDIGRSLRSKSSLGRTAHVQESSTETSDSDDVETESTFTYAPIDEVRVSKSKDGVVDVEMLDTVSLWGDAPAPEVKHAATDPGFPLTGVVSCFHPDMFLQAIPITTYNEEQVKEYLAEEDSYMPESLGDDWREVSNITIIESCTPYRIRKITRRIRSVPIHTDSEIMMLEEDWQEEIQTSINESIMSLITNTLAEYQQCKNIECIAKMITALSGDGA